MGLYYEPTILSPKAHLHWPDWNQAFRVPCSFKENVQKACDSFCGKSIQREGRGMAFTDPCCAPGSALGCCIRGA